MRKTLTAAAAATLAGIGLSLGASPASAHAYTSYQGSDFAVVVHGYSCPTNGTPCYYRNITVADRECDGNVVKAFWHAASSGSTTYTTTDGNGCGGGDAASQLTSSTISSFRVCEATSSGYVCGPEVFPQVHATA